MLARTAPAIFVCLWATGFIGARYGLPYSEPGTFLSLRFALAFALLTAVILLFRVPLPDFKQGMLMVIVGMLIHGCYLGGIFWAIERDMTAGVAAVIVGLQPLVTAILAGWWLGENITPKHWLGVVIGIIGVVFVLLPDFDFQGGGITPSTIAAALFGMISASVGTVLQKEYGASSDLRSGTALQYLGAFIPVFGLALVSETGAIDWTLEMVFAMIWLIFVLSFAAIFLFLWLIRQGSVAKVSSLFFLVPAVAAVMAYFLFGETLNGIQFLGMALCAVAVALATAKENPSR